MGLFPSYISIQLWHINKAFNSILLYVVAWKVFFDAFQLSKTEYKS